MSPFTELRVKYNIASLSVGGVLMSDSLCKALSVNILWFQKRPTKLYKYISELLRKRKLFKSVKVQTVPLIL